MGERGISGDSLGQLPPIQDRKFRLKELLYPLMLVAKLDVHIVHDFTRDVKRKTASLNNTGMNRSDRKHNFINLSISHISVWSGRCDISLDFFLYISHLLTCL